MFCNQCVQTSKQSGCTDQGMCGKTQDIQGLQDNLIYALKGVAAYAYHLNSLGISDPEINAFFAEGLYSTLTNVDFSIEHLLGLNLKAGQMTLKAMDLLKKSHLERFGPQSPVQVSTGTAAGPGILITGHDLQALYELLKQTEGTGVNVYTHSEMLPAHGYEVLRAFPHLKGNLGRSWTDQEELFARFPGVIIGSSNCVLMPKEAYRSRFYTVGAARLPGIHHVEGYDFGLAIARALALPSLPEQPGETVLTTGFSAANVLPLAGKILEAVAAGKIRHFFLVGGCDSPGSGGYYYREFVKQAPADTIVLTLACGKYRFNDLDLGDIDGIPRLLDLGQCNDAIDAVNIAVALAGALNCGVNDLPLTLVLSWTEQKAVAILMGLLALNIKSIYLGPKPPAWLTPNLFGVLQANYDLRLTSTPEADLKAILG